MKRKPFLFVFADGHTERHNVDADAPEVWSIARHTAPPPLASGKPPAPGRVVTFQLVRERDGATTFVHYRERVPRSTKAVGFVYRDGTTEVREVPWPPDLRHTVKRKRVQGFAECSATPVPVFTTEELLGFHLTEMGGTVHYRQDP